MLKSNSLSPIMSLRKVGVRSRRSENVQILCDLKLGEECSLTYKGKTPFAMWIAVQRMRLGKAFRWHPSPGTSSFIVRLEKALSGNESGSFERSKFGQAYHSTYGQSSIDWTKNRLCNSEKTIVNEALKAYDYLPKSGKKSGVLKIIAAKVGCSKTTVLTHLRAIINNGKSANYPHASQTLRWQILAHYVQIVPTIEIAWYHMAVINRLKVGEKFVLESTVSDLKRLEQTVTKLGYNWHCEPDPEKKHYYILTGES